MYVGGTASYNTSILAFPSLLAGFVCLAIACVFYVVNAVMAVSGFREVRKEEKSGKKSAGKEADEGECDNGITV